LNSSFGNAEFPDLLRILDEQAHEDKTHPGIASLEEIMENWLVEPGFPLIRIQKVMNGTFQVSQVTKIIQNGMLSHENHPDFRIL
jgi:aminopeptidase N